MKLNVSIVLKHLIEGLPWPNGQSHLAENWDLRLWVQIPSHASNSSNPGLHKNQHCTLSQANGNLQYTQTWTLEIGPDPTRAFFWPAVNKRPTRVLSDLTRSKFFWPEGKKMEKFDIFRGNFPNSNPNHKWLTRPNPSHKKLTRPDPGQKILTGTHH